MPILSNLIIISLPWIKKDNIIVRFIINTLIINSYGLIISIKTILVLSNTKELMAVLLIILIKRARKYQNPLIIFKTLLKDVTKTLYSKVIKTPAEI